MNFLLTIMAADDGDQQDVDVDLDTIDLKTPEGQQALAEAVADALATLKEKL